MTLTQAELPIKSLEERLLDARALAIALFQRVHALGLLCPGATELGVNEAILALARDEFGVQTHWHKRIVRSGPNTLCPYEDNPPDRTIEADDIIFLDFGPVFAEMESDLGMTYVLGSDPDKLKIQADALRLFWDCKHEYLKRPGMTGSELFTLVKEKALANGWHWTNDFAGHLIGEFPHKKPGKDNAGNHIILDNHVPMNQPDEDGKVRHWILEIHLIHPSLPYGAFFEDLLTIPTPEPQVDLFLQAGRH
jgi:hypothetical protein